MSDNTERRRPNANYRLSGENTRPEEIVYHYNREQRLAKAPRSVQDIYKEQPPKRPGLFRSLLDNKPRAMTFGSIVVICLMMIIASVLASSGNTHNLGGNRLSVQALKFDGVVIVALEKKAGKSFFDRFRPAYTGPVTITVLPLEETAEPSVTAEPPVSAEDAFNYTIFFTAEPVEYYRFSIPFDSAALALVLQTEKQTLNVTVKPQ